MKAPLPGRIEKCLVEEGDFVHEGDEILVMESLKMHLTIASDGCGMLHFHVEKGDVVERGAELAWIE